MFSFPFSSRRRNFSHQLIILIVNKTNSDKSLNSPNVSLSCFEFVFSTEVSWAKCEQKYHSIWAFMPSRSPVFHLSVVNLAVTKMNVIKGDFHQSEIWYVYRFNGLSKREKLHDCLFQTKYWILFQSDIPFSAVFAERLAEVSRKHV